ncbi:MAG: superoxide dismutase [Alphaproteobacteria bacterium]|nr:superoxide dismutase [Alphaproteobacteria bacterium]
MTFELPTLPYDSKALEPHMSEKTFEYHHGKHHQAYVNNLNNLIKGTEFENMSLVDIIKSSKEKNPAVFNNASQTWNHEFFWNCMKPKGGGAPKGDVKKAIDAAFGSYENFTEEFKKAATTLFGSGWVWLIVDKEDKLQIGQSTNAGSPLAHDLTPILTLDVWEHSYYLDHQNARPDFVSVFLDKLVNWSFVKDKYKDAVGK